METRHHIEHTLALYAKACDTRNWTLFETVFTQDVSVNYGGQYELQGIGSVVDMIKNQLQYCGPTQHLLGNYIIDIHSNPVKSSCYVRASHAGVGKYDGQLYDVWAIYKDDFILDEDRWKIQNRNMIITNEVGSRDILQAEQPSRYS